MHGPGTYKDPSWCFNSQFNCASGVVREPAMANLIGIVRAAGSHGEIGTF